MAIEPILGIDLGTTQASAAWVDDGGTLRVVARRTYAAPFPKAFLDQEGSAYAIESERWPLRDLAALILRELKDEAESGIGRAVRDVVLAVPAWFGRFGRGAVAEAATIAGLDDLSLLNEPLATILSLGWPPREGQPQKLLVFDVGGGSFDVTALRMGSGEERRKLTTLACGGCPALALDAQRGVIDLVLAQADLCWDDLDEIVLAGAGSADFFFRRSISDRAPAARLPEVPAAAIALGGALVGVHRHRPDHPARRTLFGSDAP